jgi:stage III sporulation protein AA
MKVGIINRERDTALNCGILELLPPHISAEIRDMPVRQVDEIRLRRDALCSLTSDGKALPLRGRLDGAAMGEILKRICGGSLYAHESTVRRGYVVFGGGVRVGVCGRAVTEGGRIVGVYDVSSLCIRLPHRAPNVGEGLDALARSGGLLIYSPPGEGKTTLLRALLARLTAGADALRCSVIDTRGELSCFLPHDSCADILTGYPRGEGIEIAARCLNPQLIVCDEIGGDMAEAQSIAAAHNVGVSLLASAHGQNVRSLLRRAPIALLHEKGIFSHYVGIKRAGSDYAYETVSADEL